MSIQILSLTQIQVFIVTLDFLLHIGVENENIINNASMSDKQELFLLVDFFHL